MLDMHVLDVASGITALWYNDRIDTPTMLQVGTQPFISWSFGFEEVKVHILYGASSLMSRAVVQLLFALTELNSNFMNLHGRSVYWN